MNIAEVGRLSLGQWVAICKEWRRMNSAGVDAPSEREFEQAIEASVARSLH